MSLLPGRIGLWTSAIDAVEPAAVPDVVGAPDEQGWDALWIAEAYGREALSAQRVQEHLDAGADHVCLQVLGADGFDVRADDWARLAPVVADLRTT